jgi:hypothetical protein
MHGRGILLGSFAFAARHYANVVLQTQAECGRRAMEELLRAALWAMRQQS